ncbi:hypothetical protein L2U69_16410 [Zavarzinia compransoris]|uniref:hypothetical protein n=1 Tax=Zavarzinia marina TaxID=2911065 RepID=UPI001F3E9E8E|nr:hypothetical protein [Zavarzinia marina]MCF4167232.1 hypothetical protein [Zavarzinia marina]
MNKIVIGAVTAVVVGVGAAAGWYFLGKESGPGPVAGAAPALDCANIQTSVDATFAALPPEVKATYSGLQCSPQKLLFAELRFGVLGAGGTEDGALRLESVVIENAFAANAKTVFDSASYPEGQAPGTAFLPIAGRLTAAKVTIGPEGGGGLGFENLQVADLAARQFAKAPPATLAELGGFGPTEAADILQAFSFSSISVANVAGGPPDSGTPGATKTVMSIASIMLSAFDGKSLGAFDLSTLATVPEYGDGKVTIGGIALRGIGVADLAALASAAGGMVDEGALGIRALLSISAESAVLSDFEATGMDSPEDRVTLKRVAIENLKALAFDELSIEGVDGLVSDADVAFSLQKLAIGGVDIGSALAPLTEDSSAEPDFAKMRIDSYEMAGLSFGPKDGAKVTLESMVGSSSDYVDGIATKGSGKMTGFSLPISIIPESERQPLVDLGYEAIKLELNTDYTFEPETKTMDLEDFTLTVVDGGSLTLKMKLGNFDVKALQEASQSFEPPLALLDASVVEASLAYKENSLIDRVLKMVSKQMQATPDALVEQVKGFLQLQMASAPGDVTKAAVQGLLDFVNKRGGLTVALSPEKPVSFQELSEKGEDMEGMAKALGLTVTAD